MLLIFGYIFTKKSLNVIAQTLTMATHRLSIELLSTRSNKDIRKYFDAYGYTYSDGIGSPRQCISSK